MASAIDCATWQQWSDHRRARCSCSGSSLSGRPMSRDRIWIRPVGHRPNPLGATSTATSRATSTSWPLQAEPQSAGQLAGESASASASRSGRRLTCSRQGRYVIICLPICLAPSASLPPNEQSAPDKQSANKSRRQPAFGVGVAARYVRPIGSAESGQQVSADATATFAFAPPIQRALPTCCCLCLLASSRLPAPLPSAGRLLGNSIFHLSFDFRPPAAAGGNNGR